MKGDFDLPLMRTDALARRTSYSPRTRLND